MCSIAMPADYEMLVSHSPPIFSHSPPKGFLSSRCDSYARPPRTYRSKSPTRSSPKRPILVIRAEDSSSDEDVVHSPTRLKKKVVFADDRGMSLTHVRVMTEPSNVPPVWSFRFLTQVTQGVTAEPIAPQEPWEITFSQPASDYLEFRKRLETNKVSLENVIIRESDDLIVGTVKVSNLSFEKEVVLRTSRNDWKTHEDVHCIYVPTTTATNSVYVLYDTFSFKLPLPVDSRKIEFCVCFRCEGGEFWDNNTGDNYTLIKKAAKARPSGATYAEPIRFTMKCADIFHAKVDSWSEFASWNHLGNNNPYW